VALGVSQGTQFPPEKRGNLWLWGENAFSWLSQWGKIRGAFFIFFIFPPLVPLCGEGLNTQSILLKRGFYQI